MSTPFRFIHHKGKPWYVNAYRAVRRYLHRRSR
jgi:hypothetical protein